MYLGLCTIAAIAVVWTITAVPTRSRSATRQPRDAHLRRCPDRVTRPDVERALRAHPLPEPTIARVLGAAAEQGITAPTMWRWVDRFGADRLVLAIDADVAERRLRHHLDVGTVPDWAAMTVFADLDLRVPPADEPSDDGDTWATSAAPVVAHVDLSRFGHLPPIYDPGLPSARSVAAPADPSYGEKGWPQVA